MAPPSTLLAAALFTGAGVMHFAKPDFFEAIVPDWFPDRQLANRASGAAEIALGLGLLAPPTRKASALGLAALTVAVFPANIDMALNAVEVKPDPETKKMRRSVGTARGPARIANWVRLPMQVPMVWGLLRIARRTGTDT